MYGTEYATSSGQLRLKRSSAEVAIPSRNGSGATGESGMVIEAVARVSHRDKAFIMECCRDNIRRTSLDCNCIYHATIGPQDRVELRLRASRSDGN